MALSAVANFFDTEADKYYLSHELSGKIHDPKINITTIKETDVASAHFALGCLKRTTMYDSLLAAARPLARKLLRAGEPGVFINPQNIQLQITAPMVELREFVTAEFIEEAQCRQPGEQVPFHVTMELVALLQLLCERDELVKEDSALSSCKSDPDADADAAAATAAALAATSRRSHLPDLNKMRVLVTGATGQVGRAVVRQLIASGATVTATARDADADGALGRLCERFVAGNLAVAETADALCAGQHAIVHADEADERWPLGLGPSKILAPLSAASPQHESVHVTATAQLLLSARRAKVLRLVYMSTAEIYYNALGDGAVPLGAKYAPTPERDVSHETKESPDTQPPDTQPRSEWSALPFAHHAASAYTATKLQAEALLQRASLDGLGTVVLRPCAVFGDATFERYLRPALSAGTLRIPARGDACIDVTHVDNVAHAVTLVLAAPAETVEGRTYNVSGEEPVRLWPMLMQLAERLRVARPRSSLSLPLWLAYKVALVGELCGFALRRACLMAPTSRSFAVSLARAQLSRLAKHSLLDSTAIRNDLGYAPIVSFQDGIRSYAAEAAKAKATPLGPSAAAAAKPPSPSASATAGATAATATTPPPAAIASVRERAVSSPDATALVFSSAQINALTDQRYRLLAHLALTVIALLIDILIALWQAREASVPLRVSNRPKLLTRDTPTGLSHTFVAFVFIIAFSIVTHPDRRSLHRRVLGAPFHTWTYKQLAAIVATQAAALRRKGVKPGSTVLSLGILPTRGHAAGVALALQAIGAAAILGEPRTMGWLAYARAVSDSRPDFVISSWRIRILLILMRPMATLGLVSLPTGYKWIPAATVVPAADRSGVPEAAMKLSAKELNEQLPTPPDDAVAAIVVGANDRAVWVSGGAAGGGAGGVRSVATALPILHWMLREQSRVYQEALLPNVPMAASASSEASAAPGSATIDAAAWVSLHMVIHYALHDLALGGCALLHPMALDHPDRNVDPVAIHSLLTRFGVTVVGAPAAIWRMIAMHLPDGSLRSVRAPLLVGSTPLPATVYRASGRLFSASSGLPNTETRILSLHTSMEGLPFATCRGEQVAATQSAAARSTAGFGLCVGTPLPSVGLRIDPEVWKVSGAPPSPNAVPEGHAPGTGDESVIIGEVIIRRPPSSGDDGGKLEELRTGDAGSIDSAGQLWLHGRLSDMVRTPSMGTVPPLDVEAAVIATEYVRWCALVTAPLSLSASAAVLIVQPRARHPVDGSPLEFGPELRVLLRNALGRTRWRALSGSVRILKYNGEQCPTDARTASYMDREMLRTWASEELRRQAERGSNKDADRMDSLLMLRKKKTD